MGVGLRVDFQLGKYFPIDGTVGWKIYSKSTGGRCLGLDLLTRSNFFVVVTIVYDCNFKFISYKD